MRLDEILTKVERSALSHWTRINAHTLYNWDWGEKNGKTCLQPILHSELYVFCLDADISIAFGAPIKDTFRADWTDRFPDHHAYLLQPTFATVARQLLDGHLSSWTEGDTLCHCRR